MTAPDIAHLRALAAAATPGPWWTCDTRDDGSECICCIVIAGQGGDCVATTSSDGYDGVNPPAMVLGNRKFIAAASPDVVVALLDRIAELDAEVRSLCIGCCADRFIGHPCAAHGAKP